MYHNVHFILFESVVSYCVQFLEQYTIQDKFFHPLPLYSICSHQSVALCITSIVDVSCKARMYKLNLELEKISWITFEFAILPGSPQKWFTEPSASVSTETKAVGS